MDNEKILDQNDLEKITGGVRPVAKAGQKEQLMKISCPYCFDVFEANVQKASVKCPSCDRIIEIKG